MSIIKINDRSFRVSLPESEIKERVKQLAQQIFGSGNRLVVGMETPQQ